MVYIEARHDVGVRTAKLDIFDLSDEPCIAFVANLNMFRSDTHARLRRAAADGAAVLIYSSDLDEVLELAGRLLVATRGSISEVPAGATRAEIGELMVTRGR